MRFPSLGRGPCRPRLATLLGKPANSSAAGAIGCRPALIIGRVIPPSVTPWARCDPRLLHGVRGVLTDIDDTLTVDGAVPMGVVAALAALRVAGIPVIAVTGRPMGWSRAIAAEVPLAAVVAENGAVALVREGDDVRVDYVEPEDVRIAHGRRLRSVAARVLAEVPGTTLARDSPGRVTDIAIDHAEFAHLDPARIARVVAVMQSEGMNATVSSIHINGWFGAHTKLTGATWIVQRLLGRDLDAERAAWLYVGDSPNDELMFASFALSVGVANIVAIAHRLQRWPAYVTVFDRGRGFVEVAESLLAARAA